MKTAVVNVSCGNWYPRGGDRLAQSLHTVGYGRAEGQGVHIWRDRLPNGCPAHKDVPYAFKLYALHHAMEAGYDQVLWLDSSMWVIKPLEPIWEHIRQHGVAVWRAGWTAAQWCHDRGLRQMGITRGEAENVSLVCGGICGFDLRNERVRQFLADWMRFAQDGVSFPGPWDATKEWCSDDPMCLGHRHDMPSLSYLVRQYGFPMIDPPQWFSYLFKDTVVNDSVIVLAQGM